MIKILATDSVFDNYTTGLPQSAANNNELQTILQLIFVILGAIAVLFLVIGGFRMVTSGGNPQELSKARGTIIYAGVGLVVAMTAESIVTFALGNL